MIRVKVKFTLVKKEEYGKIVKVACLSTIFQVQMYIVAVSVKEKKIRGHITGTKVVNCTL